VAALNTTDGEKYCALFTFIYPFRYTYEFFVPIFSAILSSATTEEILTLLEFMFNST